MHVTTAAGMKYLAVKIQGVTRSDRCRRTERERIETASSAATESKNAEATAPVILSEVSSKPSS